MKRKRIADMENIMYIYEIECKFTYFINLHNKGSFEHEGSFKRALRYNPKQTLGD